MKKTLALLAGIALLATACTPGKVIMAPSAPIKSYSRLVVVHDASNYLKEIAGKPNADKYQTLVAEADKQLGGHVRKWAAERWHGTPSGRPLTVKLELLHYNTGSLAAKIFLGSVANGGIGYAVSLLDGSRTVAQYQFEGQVDITGNSAAFWNMAKQIEARIEATE